MKIASWNVNSLRVRLPAVLRWLEDHEPDVLGLQETKMTDDVFPAAEIEAAGYQVAFAGQKTYNGVALISKKPASDLVTDLPGLDDPQRRVMGATIDGIRILNLYIPNGQALDSDKFVYKMAWLDALRAYCETQLAEHEQFLMMGDFNIAPEDRDCHDPAKWAGGTHVSSQEREQLAKLQALGLTDLFREFEQEDETFSWWDYRGGDFWKNRGLRIDLILATEALKSRCTACTVDKRPRMRKQPSDHAPVFADFK